MGLFQGKTFKAVHEYSPNLLAWDNNSHSTRDVPCPLMTIYTPHRCHGTYLVSNLVTSHALCSCRWTRPRRHPSYGHALLRALPIVLRARSSAYSPYRPMGARPLHRPTSALFCASPPSSPIGVLFCTSSPSTVLWTRSSTRPCLRPSCGRGPRCRPSYRPCSSARPRHQRSYGRALLRVPVIRPSCGGALLCTPSSSSYRRALLHVPAIDLPMGALFCASPSFDRPVGALFCAPRRRPSYRRALLHVPAIDLPMGALFCASLPSTVLWARSSAHPAVVLKLSAR
jgi:hypothetical protein